jgi:hypothetical protein
MFAGLTIHDVFMLFIALHLTCGATGAVIFWVPVLGRKGGATHRTWGKLFTRALLVTGTCAIVLSLLTLLDPLATHPHLVGKFDADFIRGIFGWMMLYLGVLTINLTWYGWQCATYKQNRAAMREWRNIILQPLLIIASANCAIQGLLIDQLLMVAISLVGFATAGTNLWFLYKPHPAPKDWLKEHLKALVGSGISVYTAFMAFGSVRILPALALNPIMWAIPLSTGISLILWHWWKIDRFRPFYQFLLKSRA